jgi:hypothetical protein
MGAFCDELVPLETCIPLGDMGDQEAAWGSRRCMTQRLISAERKRKVAEFAASLQRYVDVIVRFGVNLQPGQWVTIGGRREQQRRALEIHDRIA